MVFWVSEASDVDVGMDDDVSANFAERVVVVRANTKAGDVF